MFIYFILFAVSWEEKIALHKSLNANWIQQAFISQKLDAAITQNMENISLNIYIELLE